MTQPSLFFASGNAAIQAIPGLTEVVVATLNGVVTPLGAQTIQLNGAAYVTTGTTTTAVVVRIRRGTLTGTLVGDETGQSIASAAGGSNWYPVNGADTPGPITGGVYVLTVQNTGGGTGGTTVTAYLNAVVYQPGAVLTVAKATLTGTVVTFTFTVPGSQQWTLRSVTAVASRAVGGTPNRAYTLGVTDGTNPVAVVGADDNGTEPGTCTVTWANAPAGTIASGSVGISMAPLANLLLNPGYVITGTIVSSAVGDTWTSAVVWYDFIYTTAH